MNPVSFPPGIRPMEEYWTDIWYDHLSFPETRNIAAMEYKATHSEFLLFRSFTFITMAFGLHRLLAFLLSASVALAQLSGSVGPTTSTSAKQLTICSVLDYGGAVGSSVSEACLIINSTVVLMLDLPTGYRTCHWKCLHQLRTETLRLNAVCTCRKLQHEDLADLERWNEMGIPDGWCYHACKWDFPSSWSYSGNCYNENDRCDHGKHDRHRKCKRFWILLEQ